MRSDLIHSKKYSFALLIPCKDNYNGLIKSLKSVQFKQPFVIMVIDDCSEIPLQYEDLFKTITENADLIILRNAINQGITESLNRGLSYLYGNLDVEFVARLDAGDVSLKNRFEKQYQLLKNNSNITLCGTWALFINEGLERNSKSNKQTYVYKSPETHGEILKDMYFRCSFLHPTVMFRKLTYQQPLHNIQPQVSNENTLNKKNAVLWLSGEKTYLEFSQPNYSKHNSNSFYPYDFPFAEDYGFFWNLMNMGDTQIIQEVLVEVEFNYKGISSKNRREQLVNRKKIISTFGKHLVYKTLGIIKLKLLIITPFQIIHFLKFIVKSRLGTIFNPTPK